MTRFKFSFGLSLAIVALALIFSSVAYAKKGGVKPGDPNPGSNTLTLPFQAFGWIGDGDGCFDYSDFCADEFSWIIEDTAVSDDLDASAYAAAGAYLGCNASAGASASFDTWYVAEGELNLTRHGLNGSMHHIELMSDFTTVSSFFMSSGAHAAATASGSSYVTTGTNQFIGWHELCVWADYNSTPNFDPVVQDLCLWLYDDSFGGGGGGAYANAHADGWSSGYAENISGMTQYIGVWAANIEKFQSVTAAGASNFTMNSSGANAEVLVNAYVDSYMENYLLACSDLFDLVQGGFYSVCADGYAMAYAYAYQYAQAFVNAYASSYAETHVGMILPALYINENGTEDTVFFGDPALDFAAGTLNVSCGVSSP